jgi:hypothetical protein
MMLLHAAITVMGVLRFLWTMASPSLRHVRTRRHDQRRRR